MASRLRAAAVLLAAALAASACSPKSEAPVAGNGTAADDAAKPEGKAPPPAAPAAAPEPPRMPADGEVRSLPSGLKYTVLKAGDGPKPQRNDVVRVHYTGWLTDGTEFDSSRRIGEAAEFQVGRVIEGWNQALCEMPVGSRWKITIPADLGYGASGAPPKIPPHATLVFDVELIGVKAAPPFTPVDPAMAKKTESGLLCQVLEPGTGAAPSATDPFELEYTVYDDLGQLLRATAFTSETIQGRKEDMRMPFLQEVPFLLKVGGTLLVDVPPEMTRKPGAGARVPPGPKTTWRLKLLRVGKPRPAPAFVLPPPEKCATTASGLRHQVLVEGKGKSPASGDEVVVEYSGCLQDGTPFDNSYERGLPATFRIGPGRLIEGWNEGICLMKEGGTSLLVVPPHLGYGAQAKGGKIPANSTLVFRIELLEVKK